MLTNNLILNKSKKINILYGVFIILISIFMICISINNVLEANKKLENTQQINFNSVDKINEFSGDDLIKMVEYKNAKTTSNEKIILFFISLIGIILMIYIFFSRNIKLILSRNGIEIYSNYSIYMKKSPIVLPWENIKSIQFGYMTTYQSKISQYSMKIRYNKLNDNNKNLSKTLPIRAFNNNKKLLKTIENIGKEMNFEVFHMDG